MPPPDRPDQGDRLDRLLPAAADLLARVDASLASAGAPADHPIWSLLRRVGTLPGASVSAIAALSRAPLAGAGQRLRQLAHGYAEVAAIVPPARGWSGAAAQAYRSHWTALARQLTGAGDWSAGEPSGREPSGGDPSGRDSSGGDPYSRDSSSGGSSGGDEDTLAGRLAATAGYADALVDWIDRGRDAVADVLAIALASAEAVTMAGGGRSEPVADPAGAARAAADLGAWVLAPVAELCDRGGELEHDWAGRLGQLPIGPSGPAAAGPSATGPSSMRQTSVTDEA